MDCKLNCKKKLLYKKIIVEEDTPNVVNLITTFVFETDELCINQKIWWAKCRNCGQLFIDADDHDVTAWTLRLPTKEELDEYLIHKLLGLE